MLNNEEYLVVPAVIISEGVLHSANSEEPELALQEEFGKFPGGWNGRPVFVEHPKVDGVYVSASHSQEIFNSSIGWLFNTQVSDGKLKTEAWINLSKVNTMGGKIKETVDRISSGELTELSTGLFAEIEPASGTFNGREYAGIWRGIVPDHLAFLSSSTGACSIADGCGAPRINCSGKTKCQCGGCMSKTNEKQDDPKVLEKKEELSLYQKALGFFGFTARSKLSDKDLREALSIALTDKLGDSDYGYYYHITDVFKDNVVYYHGGTHYRRSFEYSNNKVTLGDDVERVRPETQFVAATEGVKQMDKEKVVSDLIANEGTNFTEDDKTWLLALEEDQLTKLTPKVNEGKGSSESDDDGKEEKEKKEVKSNAQVEAPKVQEVSKKKLSVNEYIEDAPAEIREVLADGINLRAQKRRTLTEGIKANKANTFTDEELNSMSMQSLEKLAGLAVQGDFSGRGGPRTPEARMNENDPPPPPKVFEAAQ